jgi:two-component system chemotaxis response regulator CheY
VKDEKRILLVDDFEMVRKMIRTSLALLGHTNVEEAENGLVALAKIKAAIAEGKGFDLVFCDWNMPEATGFEVLVAIRGVEATKKLPFVMVTAESEQASILKAIHAGATDYLIKPIAPDVLAAKVHKVFGKKAA